MTTTSAMPTAKKRPTRTRTKRVSNHPALKLSLLPPSHIDLRKPLRAVLVCEDCGTWCPITGMQSKVQKLVPHHTGKAGGAAAIHCRGSNRRVHFDMTIPEWRQALADADKETSSRRPTTVLRKPKVAQAPAVAHMMAPELDAKGALRLYRAHAEQCTICQESGHAHCPDGSPLARLYLYKLRNAPVGAATPQAEEEPGDGRALWLLREMKWASTESAVRDADTRRAQQPAGDAPLASPPVPLTTLHPQRPAR
ncbi:hypothetical protein ACFZAR_31500 [Streptomyces sp. NPDC008222]|uniref:hypothetical protein n=1 Tax=Streptomyces sp. NPDC008222 TaxID=3364820 RepID=UPI0036EE1961